MEQLYVLIENPRISTIYNYWRITTRCSANPAFSFLRSLLYGYLEFKWLCDKRILPVFSYGMIYCSRCVDNLDIFQISQTLSSRCGWSFSIKYLTFFIMIRMAQILGCYSFGAGKSTYVGCQNSKKDTIYITWDCPIFLATWN